MDGGGRRLPDARHGPSPFVAQSLFEPVQGLHGFVLSGCFVRCSKAAPVSRPDEIGLMIVKGWGSPAD